MNYFDIGIIVLVALFALVGFARGFFKTLASFFGWLISLTVAVLLAKVVANSLLNIPFVSKYFIYNPDGGFSFAGWINGILPESLRNMDMNSIRQLVSSSADPAQALIDHVKTGDSFMGMFLGIFKGSYVATLVSPEMLAYNITYLSEGIAILLANSLLILFSGIAILIVIKIITSIIMKIFEKKIYGIGKVGIFSRIFGLVLGAAKGVGITAILLIVFSFVMNFPFLSGAKDELLNKESLFAGQFAEYVFEGTDKLLKTKDLDKLMEKSQFEKIESEEQEQEPGGLPNYGDEFGTYIIEDTAVTITPNYVPKPANAVSFFPHPAFA